MNALYFIETKSPRVRGPWFLEVDRDNNSRERVVALIREGEVDPVKVLMMIEPCEDEPRGAVFNVTAEIMAEAGERPETYRVPFTGQDRIDWEHDRRRAIQAAE